MLMGIAITGLLAGIATPALAEEYAAIAAGNQGIGWNLGGFSSMEDARAAAKNKCWSANLGSCDNAVAETSDHYFSGGYCNGKAYIGASQWSYVASDHIVRNKASWDNNYDCRITVHFDHGQTTMNLQ